MKILLVNDFNEKIGGTEVYVDDLRDELIKRNHIVKIFTGDTPFKENIEDRSLFELFPLFFNFKYLIKFWMLLHKFKPDIVHLNNIFYEISPSFLLLASHIPVIMTVHDNQLYSPTSIQTARTGKNCKDEICEGCSNCMGLTKGILERFKRRVHKYFLRNIDIYIGNSNYVNSIINKLHIGKTKSIKHGINLFPYHKITNTNTLLCIGRLVEEKGIQYVIQALPKILTTYPKIQLVIIGSGTYAKTLHQMVKDKNIEKNVIFKDNIDRKEMEKYYKDSTIVLIPSAWNEPFGFVGIEAMSVGRPVIASNVGGISEWIENGKTGFLVNPRNSDQIAHAVIKILSDKHLLKNLSQTAENKSHQFSIDAHVNQLEQVYSDIINQYRNKE